MPRSFSERTRARSWTWYLGCSPSRGERLAVGGHRRGYESRKARDAHGLDEDDRPPICPRCGVTTVPAALSADDSHEDEWVCVECEELDEDE